MKLSECNGCLLVSEDHNPRCGFIEKDLRLMESCPKDTDTQHQWTIEEHERAMKLASGGTHLRNVSVILNRPYEEVQYMINTREELRTKIAAYFHNIWKENVRILQLGGHLSDSKVRQYKTGLVPFDELDTGHQNGYYTQADELIEIVTCNMDAVIDTVFNPTI